jgi:hypothetical protein
MKTWESGEDSIPPTVNLIFPQWLLGNANEALATETGQYNPYNSNGGNSIYQPVFYETGSEAIFGRPNIKLGGHWLIPCEP